MTIWKTVSPTKLVAMNPDSISSAFLIFQTSLLIEKIAGAKLPLERLSFRQKRSRPESFVVVYFLRGLPY